MFCPKCGTEVGDEHEFCKKCGARIVTKNTTDSKKSEDSSIQKLESGEQSSTQFKDPPRVQDPHIAKITKKKPSFLDERNKKGLKIGCLCLGIVITIFVLWAIFGTSAASLTKDGDQLFLEGNYAGALVTYDDALDLDNSHINAWIGKGNALLKLDRNVEAIECYDSALELEPGCDQAKDGKYNALLELGDSASITTCSDYYEKARLLKPENAEPWLKEGERYENAGSEMKAIECYDAGYTKLPSNRIIKTHLFDLCEKNRPFTGELEESNPNGQTSMETPEFSFLDPLFDTYTPGNYYSGIPQSPSYYETNQMTFDNNFGESDSVAILKSGNNYKYTFFVRKGDEYTKYRIPDRIYDLYFTTGKYWNPVHNTFMENVHYYKIDDHYDFNAPSGKYWTIEQTLYTVPGGKVKLTGLSESSFPTI